MGHPGDADLRRAAASLAAKLPDELEPLARLAYDLRWAWTPGGVDIFREIGADRFEFFGENPVELLEHLPEERLLAALAMPGLLDRVRAMVDGFETDPDPRADAPSVAFVCAEFGVHPCIPIYSGGLGVLAGDMLKEASDERIPMIGVGILYSKGVFHQRIDPAGMQQEFWSDVDANGLPLALVTRDGEPLTFPVSIRGRDVLVQVWRAAIGRVPLYLLDANRPENDTLSRWITARLYVGDRATRLEQYALLGVGGMRALAEMGLDPDVVHVNEGHGAFAPVELARRAVAAGTSVDTAIESARERTIFTTHTPVPAGNETYPTPEVLEVLGEPFAGLRQAIVDLGRVDDTPAVGMTSLGLRLARRSVGVSRLHGSVARGMWKHLFPDRAVDDVPIGYVTNGVHVPTWMCGPMRELLDRYLPADWGRRADDPSVWEAVDDIPDDELWRVRSGLRGGLVGYAREKDLAARLSRYESRAAVDVATTGLDEDRLTLGFARRVATYKRLSLLFSDEERITALLGKPDSVQFVIAGKAHPKDEEAKNHLARLFREQWSPEVAGQLTFLEDYDMGVAAHLVAGCDVWVNMPRPPMEASGTSGMKSAMNGGLNLSILDGWWAEAYDGTNGWGIGSDPGQLWWEQDGRDADALFDLIEQEVLPLFQQRDADGVPRHWIAKVKESLKTIGPRFCATRMVRDYLEKTYRA
jgi:starch phosphorylase